jgi:hypothetical protein
MALGAGGSRQISYLYTTPGVGVGLGIVKLKVMTRVNTIAPMTERVEQVNTE